MVPRIRVQVVRFHSCRGFETNFRGGLNPVARLDFRPSVMPVFSRTAIAIFAFCGASWFFVPLPQRREGSG